MPEENEKANKMAMFMLQLDSLGDPALEQDPEFISIKVNGKDTDVYEFTTQKGNKYYLDANTGEQITPDK